MIAGILVILWLSLSKFFQMEQTLGYQIHSYLTIVLGTTTIFRVGCMACSFWAPLVKDHV